VDLGRDDYENRIIYLTDALPNTGNTQDSSMLAHTEENAKKGIHTTFIGVGIDFNSGLIETISKVRGANYFAIHSNKEFKQRLNDDFDFVVSPLVFDLKLFLDDGERGKKVWIDEVFGSPDSRKAKGEAMYVNTLFPSKKVDGETKGGVVLLRLGMKSGNQSVKLKTSYTDARTGKVGEHETVVELPASGEEICDNLGVRKAVLLTRYTETVKQCLKDGRLSERAKHRLSALQDHFRREFEQLNDPTLFQELELLEKLQHF